MELVLFIVVGLVCFFGGFVFGIERLSTPPDPAPPFMQRGRDNF